MTFISRSAMANAQPLYLMTKPPLERAREIDRRRRLLGLETRYGLERFHTTLLPLGDGRDISCEYLDLLHRALSSLCAEPFPIAFDKLNRNALVGTKMRELRAFQRRLVRCLIAFGIPIPAYRFAPHLSLAYGATPDRRIAIPPINWLVEEYLLIRSIHGEGRHEVLDRWPLIERQGAFDF